MNNENLDWQPIETIPENVFVDVYVFSLINPDYGLRICNVAKTLEHSLGWSGVNRYEEMYFESEYYKITHWKVITKPENSQVK